MIAEAFEKFAEVYEEIYKFSHLKVIDILNSCSLNKKFTEKLDEININILEKVDEQLAIFRENKNEESLKKLCEFLLLIDYYCDSNDLVHKYNGKYLYKSKTIMLIKKINNNINRISGSNPYLSTYFSNISPIICESGIEFDINNYYIENESNEIKIGAIPFPKEDIHNRDEIFLKSLNKAINDNCKIVFSCEACGSEELNSEVEDIVYTYPNILFAATPTIYKNNLNYTRIYYKEKNQISETCYYKHFSYTENGINVENLSDREVVFEIFHIKNFGSVGIVICKDIFSLHTMKLINQLQLDVILVSAKTADYGKMLTPIKNYCDNKRIAIICNCCDITEVKTPVVIFDYKKGSRSKQRARHKYVKKKCGVNCCGKICYFEINIKKEKNGFNLEKTENIHIIGEKDE